MRRVHAGRALRPPALPPSPRRRLPGAPPGARARPAFCGCAAAAACEGFAPRRACPPLCSGRLAPGALHALRAGPLSGARRSSCCARLRGLPVGGRRALRCDAGPGRPARRLTSRPGRAHAAADAARGAQTCGKWALHPYNGAEAARHADECAARHERLADAARRRAARGRAAPARAAQRRRRGARRPVWSAGDCACRGSAFGMLRHRGAVLGPAWLCASLSAASVCSTPCTCELRLHVGQCPPAAALQHVLDMRRMCALAGLAEGGAARGPAAARTWSARSAWSACWARAGASSGCWTRATTRSACPASAAGAPRPSAAPPATRCAIAAPGAFSTGCMPEYGAGLTG